MTTPRVPQLTKIVTGQALLDRVQDGLLAVLNPVLRFGTTMIQGRPVPAPTSSNDLQFLYWNDDSGSFAYGGGVDTVPPHHTTHELGGSDEVELAQSQITGLTAALAAKADTTDPRFPTTSEKAALAGTSGSPGSGNKYVTNADARMTDARTPTAHETTHLIGGSDEIPTLPTPDQKDALAGTSGTPSSSNPYVTSNDGRLGTAVPFLIWQSETSTTPSTGSWTTRSDGSLGATTTWSSTAGNNLVITAANADATFQLLGGQLTTGIGTASTYVRATIRNPGGFSASLMNYVIGVRMGTGATNDMGGYGMLLFRGGTGNSNVWLVKFNATTGAITNMQTSMPLDIATTIPNWTQNSPGMVLIAEVWAVAQSGGGQKVWCALNGRQLWEAYDTDYASGEAFVGVRGSSDPTRPSLRLESVGVYTDTAYPAAP